MKKAIVILLVLSLIGNVALGILLYRSHFEWQEREQENANQTLFAMQGFLDMNDVLQKMVKNASIERYELSSIQHNVIYIESAFDRAHHLFVNEINNEGYHILFQYLVALEDILYKTENIKPLDDEILNALMNAESVAGGQYEYGLAEYMQLMAGKMKSTIEKLNIQELPMPDGDGVRTIYPKMSEIKNSFINLFE